MRKRNYLSWALALLLLMGLIFPATVFAAGPQQLWVNGVDILTQPDNTLICGAGTASYSPSEHVLILNNATIQTGYHNTGICAGSYFSDKELTLRLVGDNKIISAAGTELRQGIYTFGKLRMEGEGKLEIVTAMPGTSDLITGIYAWRGLHISDTSITLRDTASDTFQNNSSGIDVNAVDGVFLCEKDAEINISGYQVGVNVPSGHIDIADSDISIDNANRGLNGGLEIDHFRILNSTVSCRTSGENGVAMANGFDILIENSNVTLVSEKANAIFSGASLTIKNNSKIDATGGWPALYGTVSIVIDDSKVKAVSTADSAIYSPGTLDITGGAEIDAAGKWCALFSIGGMTVSDSSVQAVSSNDIAIFSRHSILLEGGQIYAKGGTGLAAIAARVVKEGDAAAAAKISFTGLVEKNIGKLAFSDWFLHSGGQTRSWTSFVPADAEGLHLREDGGMANALNEVWLGDTLCAFGHDYDTEYTVDIPSTCTTEGSESLHCTRCDAVKDSRAIPVIPHTESDWIVDKIPSYTEEGSRHKKCTVCNTVLQTESIEKIPSQVAVVDAATGIKVEYEDGSVFDAEIRLVVTVKSQEERNKWADQMDKRVTGFTLAELYDIRLMQNGDIVQPNGKVKVSIPLTDSMKALTELKVFFIDEEGNLTILPSQILSGSLVFVTDHFSDYGVIGKVKVTPPTPPTPTPPTPVLPKTGDNAPLLPVAVVMLLSAITIVVLLKRRIKLKQ